MTQRAYDPDFAPLLPSLPTVQDFSSAEKIQAAREMRGMMLAPPPDRADTTKSDHLAPGPPGAPDVPIRIYTPKAAARAPRGCVLEIHGGGFMMGTGGGLINRGNLTLTDCTFGVQTGVV